MWGRRISCGASSFPGLTPSNQHAVKCTSIIIIMITIIFTFYHDHDSLPHSDLDKLHDGIGDKLSYLIQFIATFFGGLVISFLKSWKVSLLLLGFIPIFAICACTLSKASCWACVRHMGGLAHCTLVTVCSMCTH